MNPIRIDRQSIVRDRITNARDWWAENSRHLKSYGARVVEEARQLMGWHPDTNPDLLDAMRPPMATWSLCLGCNRHVAVVVRVGEPLDYDSATVDLCHDCVSAAAALIPEPVEVRP